MKDGRNILRLSQGGSEVHALRNKAVTRAPVVRQFRTTRRKRNTQRAQPEQDEAEEDESLFVADAMETAVLSVEENEDTDRSAFQPKAGGGASFFVEDPMEVLQESNFENEMNGWELGCNTPIDHIGSDLFPSHGTPFDDTPATQSPECNSGIDPDSVRLEPFLSDAHKAEAEDLLECACEVGYNVKGQIMHGSDVRNVFSPLFSGSTLTEILTKSLLSALIPEKVNFVELASPVWTNRF
ncbi:hypothetical protein DM02DRAFT_263081 [Periconia macrospinosa]|uniref:Uncharacterized protein n=1 Tax=Periconia macrospinosa TaxID=97972 RepID=A0A2V1D418_9PLEO|nr:hypothetical protein DM02DRAFT_263081 [Periconia macrospinosa]